MDRFLAYLRWLKRKPAWLRYLIAVGVVALATGLRWPLNPVLHGYPYLTYFGACALLAVLVGRGGAIFGVLLSALAAVYFFVEPVHTLSLPREEDVIALFVFLALSAVLVLVGDGLRHLVETLDEHALRTEALLRDLSFNTGNTLQIINAVLAIQASRAPTPELRRYLKSVAERIGGIARNQRLYLPAAPERVEAPAFLNELCSDLSLAQAGRRGAILQPIAQPFFLRRDIAANLALIISELVANAYQHAYTEEAPGVVTVRLDGDGGIVLTVSDNGPGCGTGIGLGVGTTLVVALVQRMNGTVAWDDAGPGCRVTVRLPADAR